MGSEVSLSSFLTSALVPVIDLKLMDECWWNIASKIRSLLFGFGEENMCKMDKRTYWVEDKKEKLWIENFWSYTVLSFRCRWFHYRYKDYVCLATISQSKAFCCQFYPAITLAWSIALPLLLSLLDVVYTQHTHTYLYGLNWYRYGLKWFRCGLTFPNMIINGLDVDRTNLCLLEINMMRINLIANY